jgi:flagellar protein FliO/FliZ
VSGSAISIGSMLQTFLGLAVVLAMIAGAAWLLKRFGAQPGLTSGVIKVIAGAAVGQRERVVLVEIAGTWLVVGVAPGEVRALHTMPKAALDAPAPVPGLAPGSFAGWLKHVMDQRNAR